jgi:hydroxymethylpyrimidine pyrophosphatase-like HAD family hydrolase
MHYLALATDYDGTIAHDGVVPAATIDALHRLQKSGRCLIMVTGRELPELLQVFPQAHLFDRIVAENGALLYHPATRHSRLLAPEPPPAFVEALRAKNVPISVGRSIVATVEPHEHEVLSAIRDLGLEWHVVFNKGSVMVLPPGITKAAGLGPALEELNIRAEHVVGVGDAENDHAFLQLCGCSVAVANALPAVKEAADWTTPSPRGEGVVELIERMLANDLIDLHPKRAHHFPKPATAHETR